MWTNVHYQETAQPKCGITLLDLLVKSSVISEQMPLGCIWHNVNSNSSKYLTIPSSKEKHSDGEWSRTHLDYRESSNAHLCVSRTSEIALKHIVLPVLGKRWVDFWLNQRAMDFVLERVKRKCTWCNYVQGSYRNSIEIFPSKTIFYHWSIREPLSEFDPSKRNRLSSDPT